MCRPDHLQHNDWKLLITYFKTEAEDESVVSLNLFQFYMSLVAF